MTRRSGGLTVPLALIAVGVLFLLINTRAISPGALERLGELWPLLLVILGLQLVFNHSLPYRQRRFAGLGAAAVIVIAAIGFALLSPMPADGTQSQEASEKIGSLTSASLDLSYGGAGIDLGSATQADQLFNTRVDYPSGEQAPDITLDRQSASLDISGGSSGFRLFHAPVTGHLTINLSPRIPWTIRIGGGAPRMSLQVAELTLSRLEISGGASRLDLNLPHPKGDLAVSLSGGASALAIRAPAGTEWRLAVDGGLSSGDINGANLAGASNLRQQSSGYTTAGDRITIEISGGVSQVNLSTG